MLDFLNQIWLVMWKNCLIRRRNYISTLSEILIPLLICYLLIKVRSQFSFNAPYFLQPAQEGRSFVDDDFMVQGLPVGNVQLLYSPNTEFIDVLIDKITHKLQIKHIERYKGFPNENLLMDYYNNFHPNNTISKVVVINFDPAMKSNTKNLKYTIGISGKYIEWNTNLLFNDYLIQNQNFRAEKYYTDGFLAVQLAIDTVFIDYHTMQQKQQNLLYNIEIAKMPAHQIKEKSALIYAFQYVLPFCIIFCFLRLPAVLTKSIVEERRTGFKELMCLMGLKSWILWLGWFLNAFLICSLIVIVFVFALKHPVQITPMVISSAFANIMNVVETTVKNTASSVLLTFLLMYITCLICYCFFMSSIFQKPFLASTASVTLFLIMSNCPKNAIRFLCFLFPNPWLIMGFETLAMFELRDKGIYWHNLFTLPIENNDNNKSMGDILIGFGLLSIFYCTLTWYFSNVYPGKYGLARRLDFPISDLINVLKIRKVRTVNLTNGEDSIDAANIEEVDGITVGIEIKNLVKIFGSKLVIKNLSLKIYENQITALLGHNGAGKTTLMSILTGLISATNGNVLINRLDVSKYLNIVRKSLGLCPQHDLHLSQLTVREHLLFFSMLKGLTYHEAKRDVNAFLEVLHLQSKADSFPKDLSGGMRRKLSLAISLVGGSKFLILDEPTTGLDPKSRREIWDLLLDMRGTRTILITTHFMEEADVLGDRIAIIDNGQLQCYGSTMFLKKRFGAGYELSIIADRSRENLLIDTVHKIVPNSSLKSYNNGVFLFNLPAEKTNQFAELFNVLERNKNTWELNGLGLSVTTLEDVFLRVTRGIYEPIDNKSLRNVRHDEVSNESHDANSIEALNFRKLHGLKRLYQQYNALFCKKLTYMKRKRVMSFVQIFAPLFLLALTLDFGRSTQTTNAETPLNLHLSLYKNSILYYETQSDEITDNWLNAIYEQVANVHGTKVNNNLINKIFNESLIDFDNYMSHIIVANAFANDKVFSTYYNDFALHSAPIAVNLLTNVILKTLLNDTRFSISLTNKPLSLDIFNEFAVEISAILTVFKWMYLFPMGVLIFYIMFLLLPHTERVTEIRRLHYISGVSQFTYWFSHFIFDLIVLFFVVILMCILLQFYDTFGLVKNFPELGIFVIIITLFGAAGILCSYVFSFFNETSTTAVTVLSLLSFLFGFIGIADYFLQLSQPKIEVNFVINWLFYVSIVFPFFPFIKALLKLIFASAENQQWNNMSIMLKKQVCNDIFSPPACCDPTSQECKEATDYFFGNAELWKPITVLVVDIVLYALIVFILEMKFLQRINEFICSRFDKLFTYTFLDTDVREENEQVQRDVQHFKNTGYANCNLLVMNLEKIYRKMFWSKTNAVKALNFRVKSGECFGLLGTNGAGKSTTFRMLTGGELMTNGNAFVENYSLKKNTYLYLSKIGYCPQNNPLYDFYTGHEMLTLFGKLRGIRPKDIQGEVSKWIIRLGLDSISNRKCIHYSGGNKRRLCAAVAMIGDPSFVLLDEPTSGVDPSGRRTFWDILARLKHQGQSILLSSHSMDECEVLCDRLSIMDKGQMMCIGNIKHLKQKFCQGFNVFIKLFPNIATDNINKIKSKIKTLFEANLKDEHQTLLHYHLLNVDILWSQIFENMENCRNEFNNFIEDYMVSETTLEQIFLSFSR